MTDMAGDASEQDVMQSPVTVGSEDDQVGPDLLGMLHDDVAGIPIQ